MPIFEFICNDCGRAFEELVRSASAAGEVRCPACQSQAVKKKVSTFASRSSGGFASPAGYSSAGSSCSTGST